MEISFATIDDLPELCQLLNQLFTLEQEFQPDEAAQQRGLKTIIETPHLGQILIARDAQRIVGMVNLLYSLSTALGEPVALLEDMIVLAEARGTGVGTQLVEAAINHLTANGFKRITLLTDADNDAAHHFYQRLGFSRSSMIPFRKLL